MSQHSRVFRVALPILLLIFLLAARAEAQHSPSAAGPGPAQDTPPLLAANSTNTGLGAGTYLTYQGRLTNKAGEPITTSVNIVFRLYDAGSTLIYTSNTHPVTPIEGMFTAHIGAPPDPPLDQGVLSTVAEVGVTVGSDAEMTPRQSINTVIGASVAGIGVAGNSQASHGVYGFSNSSNLEIAGVHGENGNSGSGVYGLSDAGPGVYGVSNNIGVYGYSPDSTGVDGFSETGTGVLGNSLSHIGVAGYTNGTEPHEAGVLGFNYGTGPGVFGTSVDGAGVRGTTTSTHLTVPGVYGRNYDSGSGVYGLSDAGPGVYGESTDGYGVYGYSPNSTGVDGFSESQIGVLGTSLSHIGVAGYTTGTDYFEAGVLGFNYGTAPGVYGESTDGYGVYGSSTNSTGVDGFSEMGTGVLGNSLSHIGVAGYTTGTDYFEAGVLGFNYGTGPGLFGESETGIGVRAQTITGTAGYLVASGSGQVLQLRNGGAAGSASDGSGGGAFIEATNRDGQDVQFRVTTSGTVQSDGSYTTPAADFAEMLPAVAGVEPADVLVIRWDGRLARSTAPYQTTVVGVYSTEPGFIGGSDMDGNAAGEIPLAIMGVVPVKVSAENGTIRPGDLLVASTTPGHAMRAGENPPNGTVIGKALGSLTEGTGVIQMLVMLQ